MEQTFTAPASIGDIVCLPVNIINDQMIECNETFFVTLTLMPTNVEIGQTMVTIQDDEGTIYKYCAVVIKRRMEALSFQYS